MIAYMPMAPEVTLTMLVRERPGTILYIEGSSALDDVRAVSAKGS